MVPASRVALVVFALFAAGCAASLPRATPLQAQWAQNRWPGSNDIILEEWRTLYGNRCSGCHGIYAPPSVPMNEWPEILEKMAVKAKLNRNQKETIWRYIQTVSQTTPDVK